MLVEIIIGCSILAIGIGVAAWFLSRRGGSGAGPQSVLVMEAPSSSEGYPVRSSGVRVKPDTRLEVGETVLSFSQGRWWGAEIVAIEANGQVRIHFPGWDSKWDVSLPKTQLQVDVEKANS
jgi:hypothetical protein